MDKGTVHNIMIELNMSSDQFNLVTVAYYVRVDQCFRIKQSLTDAEDSIHHGRSTFEPCPEVHEAVSVASPCDGAFLLLPQQCYRLTSAGFVGRCTMLPCSCQECRRSLYRTCTLRSYGKRDHQHNMGDQTLTELRRKLAYGQAYYYSFATGTDLTSWLSA